MQFVYTKKNTENSFINSLWPSEAMWLHKTGATLVQVMPCCLTTPSHYLNQYLLITSEVLQRSVDGNVPGNAQDIYAKYQLENF